MKNQLNQIQQHKECNTLYRKQGKKYKPANDPWAHTGLREGWWLVGVQQGSTTIRHCVYPDTAHIQAAAKAMEDKLIEIIRKASEARPQKTHLTPDEKRDWDWFIKKHGASFNTLCYPSFAENAELIVKALTNEKK